MGREYEAKQLLLGRGIGVELQEIVIDEVKRMPQKYYFHERIRDKVNEVAKNYGCKIEYEVSNVGPDISIDYKILYFTDLEFINFSLEVHI